jgi:hypothetical protein
MNIFSNKIYRIVEMNKWFIYIRIENNKYKLKIY